jgi:hypothetical protein
MSDVSPRDEEAVDREALLCALVLSPLTFPRNRFFPLFTQPWARKVRSRATQIRSILRHLSRLSDPATQVQALADGDEGGVAVRYVMRDLNLSRTTRLDRLEIAILRFALARAGVLLDEPTMQATDEDRGLVENALAKLGHKLELGSAPRDVHAPDTGGS